MARTVADLAKRALERLHVLEEGETPSAANQATVVGAFNDWLDGLFADGLTPYVDETATTKVALVEGVTYTAASDFPIKPRHFEGVSAILACELEDDFGGAMLTERTRRRALIGEQRIEAAFKPSFVSTVDRQLLRLPSSVLWPSDN